LVDSFFRVNIKRICFLVLFFPNVIQANIDEGINQESLVIASKENAETETRSTENVNSTLILNSSENVIEPHVKDQDISILAYKTLSLSNADLNRQVSTLTAELALLRNDLKQSLESKDNESGTRFEVWIGLLLACVTFVLTGVGVIFAVLAFFGYSNIKNAAIKGAVDKSDTLVQNAINSGEFNNVIFSAVQRIVYRGILSDEDFPETEDDV